MTFVIYLLTGVFAGTLSGLLGVGGGIIVVPTLIFCFQSVHLFTDALIMHVAVGTSLAIMIFTSLSSANAYYRRGFIVWPVFIRFLPGLCVGMIAGSMIAKQLSSHLLIMLFALFLIIIAVYLFFSKPEKITPKSIKHTYPLLRELVIIVVAILIGLLSTIFGIGGGLLMVPFFLLIGLEMHEASGTSSICGVPISIIGTIVLTIAGWDAIQNSPLPAGTIGYVYWPAATMVSLTSIIFAPIGARLSIRFRPITLKRILACLLIASSINLLLI